MAEYVVVDKEQLESDLTVVADAIRAKGGTTEQLEFPQGMAEAVEAIETGGSDYNPWEYATFNNGSIFRGSVFPNDEVNIKFVGLSGKAIAFNSYMFMSSNVRVLRIEITEEVTSISAPYFLYLAEKLEEFYLNRVFKISNGVSAFGGCISLKAIRTKLDLSLASNITGIFTNCEKLETVSFVQETIMKSISFAQSSLLSDESIQSIIDALADLTGATAQTITFNSAVVDKLTDEQMETILAKNWTIG